MRYKYEKYYLNIKENYKKNIKALRYIGYL